MFQVIPIIKAVGYLGIFGIIFLETGLLIGIVLPGDTLLFSAGLLASQGYLNLAIVLVGASIAAIVGSNLGYWTGQALGPRLFTKEDSVFFRKSYVSRAQRFFETYGPKTILIACYVPLVRTMAPLLAGVARMPQRKFFAYNLIGAMAWCLTATLVGYFFGSKIPNIDAYMLPIVLGVFVVSFIPLVFQALRGKK